MTKPLPLELAAQEFPDAIAYRDPQGEFTYRQLRQDVERRQQQLASLGLQRGDRIAWCPKNDYETLVVLWGILHSDAIAFPIGHRFPESKRKHIVDQHAARWLEHSNLTASTRDFDGLPSPATITLSSGSTGDPKAVVHTLASHVASAEGAAARIPLAPGDGWLWALPVFHVGGLSIPFRCALSGATLCGVASPQPNLSRLVCQPSVTHVSLVPTQLSRLLASELDLAHLRAILLGGMAAPTTLLKAAIDRGLPIQTTYGLTEMASQVTTSDVLREPVSTSGRLLPGREVRISSRQEILVRGNTMCVGYLKNGKIEDPADGDGWLATRDRGRITSSGELEVFGRFDNQFVSGGENIYPESIEAELQRLPSIRQAVVVPRQDAEFGQRPVAFVNANEIQSDDWREQLRKTLAGFEIPVAFLPWPAELTSTMKPDRARLRILAENTQKDEC